MVMGSGGTHHLDCRGSHTHNLVTRLCLLPSTGISQLTAPFLSEGHRNPSQRSRHHPPSGNGKCGSSPGNVRTLQPP